MFKSNEETALELARLREFFEAQPDHAMCSWLEIERATSVVMDARGRRLATRVLRRRGYEIVSGLGVRLASSANAAAIVEGKVRRIGGALSAAKKSHESMSRFTPQMSEGDRQRMIARGAFFGALDLVVRPTRALPKP